MPFGVFVHNAFLHVDDIMRYLNRSGRPRSLKDLGGGQYVLTYQEGDRLVTVHFNSEWEVLEEHRA